MIGQKFDKMNLPKTVKKKRSSLTEQKTSLRR